MRDSRLHRMTVGVQGKGGQFASPVHLDVTGHSLLFSPCLLNSKLNCQELPEKRHSLHDTVREARTPMRYAMRHLCRSRICCLLILFHLVCISSDAKDQWISVRSENFFLVGNDSEKDIRQVALK